MVPRAPRLSMQARLAALFAAFLLAPFSVAPVDAAPVTIQNAPSSLVYGLTVTINTDATTGTVSLFKPSTDGNAQATLPAVALPYAGNYDLVSYKDLGNPGFTYSNAFVEQNPAPCDGTNNAPELYQDGAEVGSGFSSITKDTVSFNVQVTE